VGLSRRPAARARQLANLTARPPAPPSGNQRARRHGGYSTIALARLDAKAREVFDALAADAPMRDADQLPAADAALVRLAAECMCRIDTVSAYLAAHGVLDDKGNVRPAAELEGRLRREAADYLDALGMTPRSRAKLGLDVARAQTFDLAEYWAAQDVAAERADVDGQAHELDDGADRG